MAVDHGYHAYIMELLAPIGGVKSRPMFGGYGIYQEGAIFALIAGSTLYFKVSGANQASFEESGGQRFERMPYFSVPTDVLEEADVLLDWARIAIAVGHATATMKRRK